MCACVRAVQSIFVPFDCGHAAIGPCGPKAFKLLTLFPKEFAKALNMISAMIALLVVGFGMPVSATRLAGAAQVASVCAQTAALSHNRYEMRRGKCYAA